MPPAPTQLTRTRGREWYAGPQPHSRDLACASTPGPHHAHTKPEIFNSKLTKIEAQ